MMMTTKSKTMKEVGIDNNQMGTNQMIMQH